MHHIAFTTIKDVVHITRYIVITYDKVTMIKNQSWANIHAYIVNIFKHIPILLNVESWINGSTFDNLINVILNSCWSMEA